MTTGPPNKNNAWLFAAADVLVWVGASNLYPPTTGFEDPAGIAGADYRCVGWVDTSGYIFKWDESTKDIPAAGTLSSIRTILTGGSKSAQFTCLEALNPYALALYEQVPIFPVASMLMKPASGSIGSYVLPDPPGDNRYAMIFDATDGTKKYRLYAPNCKVSGRGDQQVQQADITTLQMTVTMYPGTIGANTAAVGKRWIDWGDSAALTPYFAVRS
jgi:hypothetical protein